MSSKEAEQGHAVSSKESGLEEGAGKRRRVSERSEVVMPLDMDTIRAAWRSPCDTPARGGAVQETSSYNAASIKVLLAPLFVLEPWLRCY